VKRSYGVVPQRSKTEMLVSYWTDIGHCNSAIGFLRESPLLARAAATYLEQQLTKEFTGE